ncbi:MAG: ectonucleotide pyrophosphatase/phosphodiesterase [Bryobacterales bacterium]
MRNLALCLILSCALLLRAPAFAAEHVVLVSIDGFAAYHLLNAELELPNIRRLIREGAWAASSETVFPSVTHPSHTTILTGVEPRLHGVLSNSLTNQKTGETFHPTNKPRTEIVTVDTLFDAAKKKGLSTASFFWPETKDDPSVDFNIPEVFTDDHKGDIRAVKKSVLDELTKAGVPIDLYFEWYGSERMPAADMILADAAAYTIKTRKPGLLAIHILATDEAQHTYGPHHYEAQAALTNADACVGKLMEAVEEAGLKDSTTFIVTADHGFHSVEWEMNIRQPFEQAGLLDKIELGGGGWGVRIVRKPSFSAADRGKLEQVLEQLEQNPWINRVIRPDELHALGLPNFGETIYANAEYIVLPDIDTYLSVKPGGKPMERVRLAQPSHSHGYLPTHPRMFTSLLLSGADVRKGALLGHVRNLDIAPTIARVLGLNMPKMSGRVLTEALTTH